MIEIDSIITGFLKISVKFAEKIYDMQTMEMILITGKNEQ